MIVSFRCAETEKIFQEQRSRKFDSTHRVAFRRLHSLDAATTLSDLAGGGMSVEALKRDRAAQHSIGINSQYRICFVWQNGNAAEVEIVGYH